VGESISVGKNELLSFKLSCENENNNDENDEANWETERKPINTSPNIFPHLAGNLELLLMD